MGIHLVIEAPVADHEPDLMGPDMRAVPPVEQHVDWLDAVANDPAAYAALFIGVVRSIGDISVMVARDGTQSVVFGRAFDDQEQQRTAHLAVLGEHMLKSGHRSALISRIWDVGTVLDQRPHLPGLTTECIRDFLTTGGRLLITPDGRVEEGGEFPRALINGTDAEIAECRRASRNYYINSNRGGARAQILRTIQMCGRQTSNGWFVMEIARG